MTDLSVLGQLLIVLIATLSIVFIFQKLRLPPVVGFLLSGVIMGPNGFQWIRGVEDVRTLAEIGVVLLLFTIGLEFSIAHLASIYGLVLWAGLLQIGATSLVVVVLSFFMGFSLDAGIFYGFLISLSSTAIVLRIYSDRREVHALHGRLITGILLFQDLCIIPMMLLVPLLGPSTQISLPLLGWTLAKALFAVLLVVLAARYVFPWLLHQVAQLRNRELFILFIVLLCLGTAWLTSEFGLSLALGAFIAGLLLSESEYSHQILSEVLPLRDTFSGIFFVSIGMLLDLQFVASDPRLSLAALFSLISIKALVVLVIIGWLYRSVRLGVVLGLSLAQVGEFSFILAQEGKGYGLLTPLGEQTFLAASILSMIATPFLIQWVHGLAFGLETIVRSPLTGEPLGEGAEAEGHVLVVGYGLNGQNLTRVLKEVGVPYRILDLDTALVRRARAAGEPIFFGDGTRTDVLKKMGIEQARVLVVAISDPLATAHMVSQARRLRRDLYIIVRTRYVAEIERLYQLGANQVIPEEFETSIEIFARVLQEYHIPRNVISMQVDLIRKEHYGTLRGLHLQARRLDELSQFLAETTTDIFLIPEASPAAGKRLGEIELRSRSGVTVIAVVREGKSTTNPGAAFLLAAGDILVLLGSHKELDQATQILRPPGEQEAS